MRAKQLQNILTDNLTVEDLILAKSDLSIIDSGFQTMNMESPEWVTNKLSDVSGEITNRVRADLQKQLRAAKARREALATPDEKRKALEARIEALEKQLNP